MDINANLDTIGREKRDADIARQLGSDLWSLVCAVAAELITMAPVIGDNYQGYQPSAFRLRFADGRVLKGRRVETAAQAQAVEYLSQHLEYRGLPRVVARRGAAYLSEWIEGQPLSASQCDPQVLRQCGALQGFAHSQPLPAVSPPMPPGTSASWQQKLMRRLNALVDLAILDHDLTRRAADIAAAYVPSRCAWSFAYVDFCADNIVLQVSGDVCVVDTETLSIQPSDYDVARTWYRWPMLRDEREQYFGGYVGHRELTTFLAHFPYWAIAAIVDGALFRGRRAGAAAAAVPAQRLRALVCDLERGVAAEDAVFVS